MNDITIPTLHVGRGYSYGPLTWFPIWTDAEVTPRRYDINQARLVVSELSQERVPVLSVTNPSERPIVMFEGSVFEGGLQHRTLTTSIVIPARAETEVPVVCVEAQRWGGSSRQHRVGQRIAPARVRAASRGLSRDLSGNIRRGESDQSAVWSEVRQYQQRHGVRSDTDSMLDVDDSLARNQTLPPASALPGQRGVIVAALGQPIALELYDHPDTLAERLESILQGFRLDVFGAPSVETPSRRARRFADYVMRGQLQEHPHIRMPGAVRSGENPYVASDGLVFEGELLHLSALNPRHELVLAA